MKPYAVRTGGPARLGGDRRGASGLTRVQAVIAVISFIATALGSISAAVSSYLSWRQVTLADRERMTPYRTIVYGARLDSYRRFVASQRRNANALRDLVNVRISNINLASRYTIPPEDQALLHRQRITIDRSVDDMVAAIDEGGVVWPVSITTKLKADEDSLLETRDCEDVLIHWLDKHRRHEDHNAKVYAENSCEDRIFGYYVNSADMLERSAAMMRADLRNYGRNMDRTL